LSDVATGSVLVSGGVGVAPSYSSSPTLSGTVTANTLNAITITSPAATNLTIQSAGTTAMTIDTSQNVGIGTSSPGAKLQVNGIIQSGATGTNGSIQFLRSSDGAAAGSLSWDSTNTALAMNNGVGTGVLTFLTNSAERMRIDSSGNVGIGTTSVLGKQTNSYDGNTAFGLALANTAGGTAGQIAIRFMRNGSDVGSVTTTNTATAYNTSSDYRLKENVLPLTSGLTTISALKPVTYNWISDSSEGEGFIAHELQAVIPLAVTGEKDAVNKDGSIKPQGVDYSKIVVHLVAALQELDAKFEAYKASHP